MVPVEVYEGGGARAASGPTSLLHFDSSHLTVSQTDGVQADARGAIHVASDELHGSEIVQHSKPNEPSQSGARRCCRESSLLPDSSLRPQR